MDKAALKIQALLEKISSMTTTYENREADLRVEITVLNERVRELEETKSEEEGLDVPYEADTKDSEA